MEGTDRMSFDGSCNPNPGGRMGWSAIITFADGRSVPIAEDARPHATNTVNIAEYRGLRAGLRAYLDAGGRGPLHITGDSQLVINQVNGVYKVKKAELQPYHADITALCAQIGDVSVTWHRREHNTAADQLARGTPHQPDTSFADDLVVRDPLQDDLAPPVLAAIARLNQNPAPGFKDFAGLRTGGVDACSKLKPAAMQERAGSVAVARITTALDDPKAQATALRWVLRGLGVQRAIQKVQVDADIAAQSQHRSNR